MFKLCSQGYYSDSLIEGVINRSARDLSDRCGQRATIGVLQVGVRIGSSYCGGARWTVGAWSGEHKAGFGPQTWTYKRKHIDTEQRTRESDNRHLSAVHSVFNSNALNPVGVS